MRVLVVSDWPVPEGGTERAVEVIVAALRERGDEVRLLTSSVGSAADGTADYVAFGTDRRALQAGLQVANPSAVLTLRRALAEFRPDAVHVNMFMNHLSPAILTLLRDVPAVVVVHDYKATCENQRRQRPDGSQCDARAGAVCWRGGCVSLPRWLRDRPRYALLRRGISQVAHVRAISAVIQAELLREDIVADVLYQPVSPPGSAYVRAPAAAPVFAYGGRLAPVKGVDVLLQAFARVHEVRPDARLELYGDGPDRDALVALARRLGIDDVARFNPHSPRDWADQLAPAWALVAPSTYREPLGLVAVEAIVRGVPVIASGPDGGFGETVEPPHSGAFVRRGDVDDLTSALLAVAGRAEAQTVPDAVAAAIRERHDPHRHADSLHAIFEGARSSARTDTRVELTQ